MNWKGWYNMKVVIVNKTPFSSTTFENVTSIAHDSTTGNITLTANKDKNGNIWVGTDGDGVYILKNNKLVQKYSA